MAGTLEHLTNEAPRWHPSQIPQQHQLAKLACGRVAALLRASPKRPSSSPFRGNSFPLLAISLCHHPELVFTGEGRNLDWPVTQQCHFHTWVPCCKEMCHRQVALIGADRLRLIATCWWSVCICKVVTVICKCSPICLAWLQTVWVGPQLLWDSVPPDKLYKSTCDQKGSPQLLAICLRQKTKKILCNHQTSPPPSLEGMTARLR